MLGGVRGAVLGGGCATCCVSCRGVSAGRRADAGGAAAAAPVLGAARPGPAPRCSCDVDGGRVGKCQPWEDPGSCTSPDVGGWSEAERPSPGLCVPSGGLAAPCMFASRTRAGTPETPQPATSRLDTRTSASGARRRLPGARGACRGGVVQGRAPRCGDAWVVRPRPTGLRARLRQLTVRRPAVTPDVDSARRRRQADAVADRVALLHPHHVSVPTTVVQMGRHEAAHPLDVGQEQRPK